MSKSDAFEAAMLKIIFNATALANVFDNAAASPITNIYVSLHTADPTDAGTQSSSECTYTGYARAAVIRTTGGWAVTGTGPTSCSPVANIDFPICTAGTNTATFFGVGTLVSGTGFLFYSGTVTPNISISNGVTPRLTTASTITED